MLYSENYISSMDRKYNTTMATDTLRNIYFSAPTSAAEPGKQIKDIIGLAGGGVKNVEIGQLRSRGDKSWETIPRQHFDMVRQTAKLTMGDKAIVSVHAPIDVDPTGFKENKWSEDNRADAEEFMKDVINKAALVKIDKNSKQSVPIAYHASGQIGTFWKWDEKKDKLVPEMAMAVIPDTGELIPLKTEEKIHTDGIKRKYIPYYTDARETYPEHTESSLEQVKHTLWEREQEQLNSLWKEQQEAVNRIKEIEKEKEAGEITKEQANAEESGWASRYKFITKHLDSALTNTYDKIAQSDPKAKKIIDTEINNITKQNPDADRDAVAHHIMMKMGLPKRAGGFGKDTVPELVKLAETFGQDQAAKTLANLAYYSYKKHGEYGPQLAVENWDPWHVMGRGADLRDGLKKARVQMVDKLVTKDKLPVRKANEIADRLIGATWDIAHINIMKRFGVPEGTPKENWNKYIKREVEAIQDDIRHIHISDNFGHSDVHLAPGMGNVPIKEFLEHMEKTGKLKEVKSVLESAGTAIHLGIPPIHAEALQHMGVSSPAWSTSPNWYEVSQNYFFGGSNYASAGFGNILPQGHFSEYGAGFSQLPTATGGMRPDQKSKFSNTPMS